MNVQIRSAILKAAFIYIIVNWRETLEMRTCARECFVYPDIKKTRWLFRRVAQFAYAHNCVSLVNSSYSLLNEDILAMLWFKHEGSSRNQWTGSALVSLSTLVEMHFITHHCALWVWGSCEMWITSHSCCNGWEAIFSQRAGVLPPRVQFESRNKSNAWNSHRICV